ncbi:MAG: metalloregulator ArsR/SmtB family transcription factor [Rhizobiaceae bacterium]
MLSRRKIDLSMMVDTMKAAAESSRLRILVLLSHGDLTVSDLTEIMNQSQPRVSRHLKLLLEAALIERYQEGSWAYFRLSDLEGARQFVLGLASRIDDGDPQIERDLERLAAVKQRRRDRAAEYFRANAASWDEIRSMHAPDRDVEAKLLDMVGTQTIHAMLDLGTGTGRLLELFGDRYRRGVGIDLSREMLTVARSNLDQAGITHAQVRHGDVYAPPVDRDSFDLVTIHQVLHFLDDPALTILEAARVLRPAGRLAIVDFAPHGHEFLRNDHAHVRLGFSDAQIGEWLSEAGLELVETGTVAAADGDGLVVKIWLARDPRLLIAETQTAGSETA